MSSPTWLHGMYFSGSFSSSDAVDPLQDVQQKIRAIEYCLDNFDNVMVPFDADVTFARLIRRYDSADKGTLLALLKDLQGEKTILLASQIPERKGRRMNVVTDANPFVLLEFIGSIWFLTIPLQLPFFPSIFPTPRRSSSSYMTTDFVCWIGTGVSHCLIVSNIPLQPLPSRIVHHTIISCIFYNLLTTTPFVLSSSSPTDSIPITMHRIYAGEEVEQEGTPSPRKGRWDALNLCLRASKKAKGDSASYSSVKYTEVQEVFEPITHAYTQDIKTIPDEDFDLLVRMLGLANTTIGEIITGKEAKRLYFIAHILMVVCNLFKGDVRIKVEEDLVGKNVKANGRFEFMLERGRKRVCIVEAKKEDMEQGLAQNLIGCEVASDVDDLRIVYGIVTTFISWTFLKSCDDKIYRDDDTLDFHEGTAEPASLKKIAGKIFAMLSDD